MRFLNSALTALALSFGLPAVSEAAFSCEGLFKSEFHHGFRESNPNDFIETLPRHFSDTRARHSLDMLFWELPFATENSEAIPRTWAALAEYLKPGVVESRCPECKNPAKTRIAIASILSRAHGRILQPGEPIPLDELEFQAKLLGAQVEIVPIAFRVDSRPPHDVAKAGFRPNPAQHSADLWDHVRPDNVGGGNLVSVSLAKVHLEVVKFILARKFKMANLFTRGTPYILDPDSNDGRPANIDGVKLYEYMMFDVAGVQPPAAFSVAAENEMVAPDVAPWQISYFRVLSVKIKKGHVRSVTPSGWERMPPPR